MWWGIECVDDNAGVIIFADGLGLTVSGCADILSYCEAYAEDAAKFCPVTCGFCPDSTEGNTLRKYIFIFW